MKAYLSLFALFSHVHKCSSVDIMPELQQNILNFGYSVNFKCEGMLLHSLNRFDVVTKFELPKIEDLHLMTIQFHSTCNYLGMGKSKELSN